MSGITITVDAGAALDALARLRARGEDLRPVLDQIGQGVAARIRQTFVQQADPYGHKWLGLKRSTLRKRRKAGKGAQILRDTGRLMNSITHQVADNAVTISTDVEYAAIQQAGGTIHRAARAGRVRLRATASGQLLRQKGHANLAVFAKASHKRAVERSFAGRDYTITLPARPFFPDHGLPDAWMDEATAIVMASLREAVQ